MQLGFILVHESDSSRLSSKSHDLTSHGQLSLNPVPGMRTILLKGSKVQLDMFTGYCEHINVTIAFLGIPCHAGRCCGSSAAHLCVSIICFISLASCMAPSSSITVCAWGLDFQVSSSLNPLSPISEMHDFCSKTYYQPLGSNF